MQDGAKVLSHGILQGQPHCCTTGKSIRELLHDIGILQHEASCHSSLHHQLRRNLLQQGGVPRAGVRLARCQPGLGDAPEPAVPPHKLLDSRREVAD